MQLTENISSNIKTAYTTKDKQQAALLFVLYGSYRKVTELSGIPNRTLYDWNKTEWWQKLTATIREQNKDKLNADYGRILDKTIKQIENQIENGEVKALDAAKIHGIMFDKRQILNNQPTSITGKTKEISDLAEEFNRYLNAKTIDIEVTKTDS